MNADLAAPAAPAGVSQRLVAVLENVAIARDTYRLRLDDPILARAILPGPFLMIRPAVEDANDPLLGRPFALYGVTTDAAGAPTSVDVVYLGACPRIRVRNPQVLATKQLASFEPN